MKLAVSGEREGGGVKEQWMNAMEMNGPGEGKLSPLDFLALIVSSTQNARVLYRKKKLLQRQRVFYGK